MGLNIVCGWDRLCSRLWFGAIAWAACGGVVLGPSCLFAVQCGHIVRGQGLVEVLSLTGQNDEQGNPVRRGARLRARHPLDCSDIVLTGERSRCVVQLTNARLTLGPNSRIAISKYMPSGQTKTVNLTYGKARVYVPSVSIGAKGTPQEDGSKEPPFRVRTQSAVVGVRGTDFFTKFDPNSGLTNQATLKGEVTVERRGSSQSVRVASGQQVDVVGTPKGINIKEETLAEAKPEATGVIEDKPLEVRAIDADVVSDIQDASLLAKTDKEFTSDEAVKVLGPAKSWKPGKDDLPESLKDIRNEF